ncbi:MAG: hypothetical protein ACTSPP_10250 [Candidatus Heimdallarchaeaceae archaeon]
MQYYIPEWDDLVSSRYDYWNDTELPDSRKVYAHEIYPKPNYDAGSTDPFLEIVELGDI